MKFPVLAGAILATLSSSVAAGVCGGAYISTLTPAPADCSRRTVTGDTVTADYKGLFPNGTVFDQSYNSTDGPIVYQYDVGQVIIGFDQGLKDMCVGEKRWVMIPPEFGYGNRSVGGGLIPPQSTLIFEILLRDIETTPSRKRSVMQKRRLDLSEMY